MLEVPFFFQCALTIQLLSWGFNLVIRENTWICPILSSRNDFVFYFLTDFRGLLGDATCFFSVPRSVNFEIRENTRICAILRCSNDLVFYFFTDVRALLKVVTCFFCLQKFFFRLFSPLLFEDRLGDRLVHVLCAFLEKIGGLKLVSVICEDALQQLGIKVRKLFDVHKLSEDTVEKQLRVLYFMAKHILQIVRRIAQVFLAHKVLHLELDEQLLALT